MLGYFDFTALAAGGESVIYVQGSYLRYYSGSAGGADTRIIVRTDGGLRAILKPGQAVRLPAGLRVGAWRIENYQKAGNIAGTVVIGEGGIDDSTITGEVSVIDGALSRTLANQAFMKGVYQAAVAAQYAHTQLFNPAASGKNLYLESFSLSSTTGQQANGGHYSAALVTLGGVPLNKNLGQAAGVGVVRQATNVAQLYTLLGFSVQLAANSPNKVELREPVVIPPNAGFVLIANTVNTDLNTNFEWYEQPI